MAADPARREEFTSGKHSGIQLHTVHFGVPHRCDSHAVIPAELYGGHRPGATDRQSVETDRQQQLSTREEAESRENKQTNKE
ncbi:hypothetical protein VTH06DRAFT_8834 [Thermothelomyces fergusii]